MKKNSKKGFTLAELLIVVAIIAVLAAISIPVFSSQLEKSRDAVTVANLRAAYAEAQTAYLTESSGGNATFTAATSTADAKVVVSGVASKGKVDGFNGVDADLPFTAPADMGKTPKTYSVTFTYDTNGTIKSVTASAS